MWSTRELSRRAALRLFVSGAGVTVLAACGVGAPPVPTPAPASVSATQPAAQPAATPVPAATPAPASVSATQPAAQPASAQPNVGGTLRVGVPTDIASLA